jgi:N utilization substance protein A
VPAPKAVRAKVQTKKKKTRVVTPGTAIPTGAIAFRRRGLGSDAAGQSGDTEGLSEVATADSESVEELEEEGQAFEAEAVSGVENALDPDEGEVTTHEVPEDDVPREYDDEEQ